VKRKIEGASPSKIHVSCLVARTPNFEKVATLIEEFDTYSKYGELSQKNSGNNRVENVISMVEVEWKFGRGEKRQCAKNIQFQLG
jgi:hypothetical protein